MPSFPTSCADSSHASLVDQYQYGISGYSLICSLTNGNNLNRLMATIRHNNIEQKPELKQVQGTGATKLHDHFELVLNWYKTNNKNLAGEELVSNLHIKKLMSILGNPFWNQIYHCWQIELKHIPEIQPYISHQIDPTKFVYFIEAYNNH